MEVDRADAIAALDKAAPCSAWHATPSGEMLDLRSIVGSEAQLRPRGFALLRKMNVHAPGRKTKRHDQRIRSA
jgi:hypothetical protein